MLVVNNNNNTLFTLPESETTNDVLVSESTEQTLSNKKFKDNNNNEYTIENIAKLNSSNTFTGNQTINGILEITALGNNLKAIIRDFIYPVGSIYTSFESTPPATLFGGTWTQIINRFLYCTNSSGQEKGSSTHTHNNTVSITNASHTLTINEIPSHRHSMTRPKWYYNDNATGRSIIHDDNEESMHCVNNDIENGAMGVINYTGGGKGHTHNNTVSITNASGDSMPPYITCYAWQRKA